MPQFKPPLGDAAMRVVTLEEHYTVPSLVRRISPEAIARRGFVPRKVPPGKVNPLDLLPEIGEVRLRSMDEAGITVQVLSTSGPGADLVDGAEGVAIARGMNDALAEAITRYPDRFAGFAHLPMRDPDAAAKELARTVQDVRLPRRPHQRHDRGSLPRRSQVRAHPGGGGSPRRADLHPPPPGARGRAQGLLRQSSVQYRQRAGGGRLGLALGDGDPRAAPGGVRHARQAPEAQAHHRPHGRGPACHAGALRPGVRGLHCAPRAADQPDHPRPGLDHDQRHLQPSRRSSPRC